MIDKRGGTAIQIESLSILVGIRFERGKISREMIAMDRTPLAQIFARLTAGQQQQ